MGSAGLPIELRIEVKILPPTGEKAVEAAINSHAMDGWEVLVSIASQTANAIR